jgi:hypothetical protein
MINHQLLRAEQIKHLKLDEDSKYGSVKFAGQTLDCKLSDGKIKRVTFGVNKIAYTNLVAITWEILHNYHEEDYISMKLDQAAYENGY